LSAFCNIGKGSGEEEGEEEEKEEEEDWWLLRRTLVKRVYELPKNFGN
jgi:hypothetical protein